MENQYKNFILSRKSVPTRKKKNKKLFSYLDRKIFSLDKKVKETFLELDKEVVLTQEKIALIVLSFGKKSYPD